MRKFRIREYDGRFAVQWKWNLWPLCWFDELKMFHGTVYLYDTIDSALAYIERQKNPVECTTQSPKTVWEEK